MSDLKNTILHAANEQLTLQMERIDFYVRQTSPLTEFDITCMREANERIVRYTVFIKAFGADCSDFDAYLLSDIVSYVIRKDRKKEY